MPPALRHDLHLNAVLQTLPWPNKPSRRRSGDLLGLLPTRPRPQTEFHDIRYCWHDAVIWLIPVLPGSAYFPNAIFTIWSPHVRRKTPDNMPQVVDIQSAFQQATTDVRVIPSLGNQMLTTSSGKNLHCSVYHWLCALIIIHESSSLNSHSQWLLSWFYCTIMS